MYYGVSDDTLMRRRFQVLATSVASRTDYCSKLSGAYCAALAKHNSPIYNARAWPGLQRQTDREVLGTAPRARVEPAQRRARRGQIRTRTARMTDAWRGGPLYASRGTVCDGVVHTGEGTGRARLESKRCLGASCVPRYIVTHAMHVVSHRISSPRNQACGQISRWIHIAATRP